MTTQAPVIHNNINTGGFHLIRIVATLLLCAGVGSAAWAAAEAGFLEVAATGVTLFVVQLVKLMYSKGMISLPGAGKKPAVVLDDGELTIQKISQTFMRSYLNFVNESSTLRLAAVALGYTAAFLVMRQGVSVGLGIFSNMYVAGAAAAVFASIIVMPKLLPTMMDTFKNKGLATTDADEIAEPVVTPQTPPAAPVAPVAPVQAPAPQQEPVQAESAAPTQRVVRRVVKKVNTTEGDTDA